jgi:hypothetical protein
VSIPLFRLRRVEMAVRPRISGPYLIPTRARWRGLRIVASQHRCPAYRCYDRRPDAASLAVADEVLRAPVGFGLVRRRTTCPQPGVMR